MHRRCRYEIRIRDKRGVSRLNLRPMKCYRSNEGGLREKNSSFQERGEWILEYMSQCVSGC